MFSQLRTRRVTVAAVFAALYGLLTIIPVNGLIGTSGTLPLSEVLSPLAGMLLGSGVGAFSVVVGTFIGALLGHAIVFDGLDFVPSAVAAVTAGLAAKGRIYLAAAIPIALIATYMIDPLSSPFIVIGTYSVPFLWMHMLSVVTFLGIGLTTGKKSSAYVAATVFVSIMSAHVAGSILFENVFVRINHIMTASVLSTAWKAIFFVYPFERAFYTIAGTILAVSVLKTLPQDTQRILRGDSRRE